MSCGKSACNCKKWLGEPETMSCGKSACNCKKGLGEPAATDTLTQVRARHQRENWMATYYIGIFFILAVFAVALHPVVTA